MEIPFSRDSTLAQSHSPRRHVEIGSRLARNLMTALVIPALLMCSEDSFAARGYKCTLADGTVLHEQDTCVGKNAVKQEDEVRTKAESDADLKAELDRMDREREKNRTLRIGMTKADFKRYQEAEPLGCPFPEVNTTYSGAHTREQYVCGGGRYLYFDDGVLTSVQDTHRDHGP